MYLQRRRRRWYALHDIPVTARKALGKPRFVASLETEDRKTAERRAAPLKVRWLSEIEAALRETGDEAERDGMFWRKALQNSPEDQREMVRELMADELRNRVDGIAARHGILDERDPTYDEVTAEAQAQAQRVQAIAEGKLVRLDEHLEEYLATLTVEAKTRDMRRSTIKKFCGEFRYTSDVTRDKVQRWINRQAEGGLSAATIQRAISELRGYWTYLTAIRVASEEQRPFEKPVLPKERRKAQSNARIAFDPDDVVALHRAAVAAKDQELADLIELAMWTGARIEELCSLAAENATRDSLKIIDAKTKAGMREVPVHENLKGTVARLRKASKDGYLLSGLTVNKYGDRSGAIGHRFGRLKADNGFDERLVFHSIRKTVATLLENAQVPENVAADILGHEKPRITYGLYSGGASMDTKREAIAKLSYPVTGMRS